VLVIYSSIPGNGNWQIETAEGEKEKERKKERKIEGHKVQKKE